MRSDVSSRAKRGILRTVIIAWAAIRFVQKIPRRVAPQDEIGVTMTLLFRDRDSLADVGLQLIGRDANLLQRVAITNRHRSVLRRLTIDRDAERRADFVLS